MFKDSSGRFEILSSEYGRIYDLFEKGGYSLSSLTPADQTFFIVFSSDSCINSDGMYALWFNNHGLLDTPETPKGFREIGATKSADIIGQFVSVTYLQERLADVEERIQQMEQLSEYWPAQEPLNESYWSSGEDIDSLLIQFLDQKKLNVS